MASKKKKAKKPVKAEKKAIKKAQKKPLKPKKNAVKAVKKVLVPQFSAENLFRAKIKVIGIGGGGGSIVSEIGRSLEKATFVVADTDIRALKKRAGVKYFWFGENLTRGLGTGANPELARQAAEESKEKISGFFRDQDIIIFIASLGGGVGSGATKIFAEAARNFGGITLGIFTLPFKFEGKNKARIALKALKDLRSSLNVSITIPNERIFRIIDGQTPITQAFSIVNKSLIESLESLIDIIYSPGLINIDFADLRAILKGRGNLAFLNTIESSGKNRAEDIAERIRFNPLYQNGNFSAENILFNISGGQNLSMFEVEKISRDISELNPKAKIIFGISKDAKLKNKIKTTLLMTGPSSNAEAIKDIEIKPVEIKKAVPVVAEKAVVAEKTEKVEKKKEKKTEKKKKQKLKKPERKKEDAKELIAPLPVFKLPVSPEAAASARKMSIIIEENTAKKGIRRSALEVKKAQDLEEQKKIKQEEEWEIPAFLRRVKFKS